MATSDIQIAERALQHHFADMEQQTETATFGMWAFLLTEVMFFGGMFLAYVVYRSSYYEAFVQGSQRMDLLAGAVNTAVLICSSLTMALAVRAAKMGKNKAVVAFLLITILFAFGFLVIKGFEYHGHWIDHQFPGPDFHFQALKGPAVDPLHTEIFFSLYWIMTGFHALHVIIGIGLISWLVSVVLRRRVSAHYYNPVETVGLYWHFVDLVWIFLFPLFYLIAKQHGS